jgi:hypothetical protein
MGIIVAVFLLLCLLCLSVPIPNVPPGWRLALIFALAWFILFALEKGGVLRLP